MSCVLTCWERRSRPPHPNRQNNKTETLTLLTRDRHIRNNKRNIIRIRYREQSICCVRLSERGDRGGCGITLPPPQHIRTLLRLLDQFLARHSTKSTRPIETVLCSAPEEEFALCEICPPTMPHSHDQSSERFSCLFFSFQLSFKTRNSLLKNYLTK